MKGETECSERKRAELLRDDTAIFLQGLKDATVNLSSRVSAGFRTGYFMNTY